MAVWQYTVHLFPVEYVKQQNKIDMEVIDNFPGWQGIKLDSLSPKLNQVFGAEEVFLGVRNFGKLEVSCASLLYDEQSDSVGEISVRFDLRDSIKFEVESVLDLARSLNALIVTEDFRIISPINAEQIKEAILASDAFKFVKDPITYIESLSDQKD